jgi:hypothetical protein
MLDHQAVRRRFNFTIMFEQEIELNMKMKKIVAVPLVCAGLSMSSVTLGSAIGSGFDLFETPDDGNTFIDFGPPVGQVPLEGNPELLAPEKLGDTDTIVERKQGIDPFDFPNGEGTVDIEVVALSLKSIESFNVEFWGFPSGTTADLYVTVNALGLPNLPQPDELEPSTGSMTIDHKGNPDGFPSQGDFTSNLEVFADLIFVVAGEDIGDEANWLAFMPAPDTVILDGKGHWAHEQPANDLHNDKYPAEEFYVTDIEHTGPHQPEPALLVTLDYFTAKPKNGSVKLKWKTGTEKDNAGFVVWRGEPVNGQCSTDPNNYTNVQAITPLVNSQGTEVSGATYNVTDSNVVSGNTYCYVLEDVEYDGDKTFHLNDIVSATP